MNKKGSAFLGITLGIFLFITGVLILPYLTDDISSSRGDLECSETDDISNGTKLTCLFFGALTPYYIWFFTSLAIGLILGGFK